MTALQKDDIDFADVGRIVMADNIGSALKEYRMRFGIKQVVLARQLEISASVVADYEYNRRASPGAAFIRRWVEGVNAVSNARNS